MSAVSLISYHHTAVLTPAQFLETLTAMSQEEAAAVKLHLRHGELSLTVEGQLVNLTAGQTSEALSLPALSSSLATLTVSTDAQVVIEQLCSAEDYYHQRYQLSRTHSEVIAALPYLHGGKALDLGCGNGRNSLYLNLHGFEVQGYDRNEMSVANLHRIIASEALSGIQAEVQDLSELQISGNYDFMLSTVVMMFLPADTLPKLINQMQQHTKDGGLNLIVSAMDTEDYPCSVGFPCCFKENELLNYYAGWDIVKYNENVGELHKLDEQGNRIKLRFATMLARKL